MDLIIIGAGDVGGFIAYHAHQMGKYRIMGFLDDNSTKHGTIIYDLPVIGNLDYLLNYDKEIAVAIAIANPKVKCTMFHKLKQNSKIIFPSFIHPNSWIGSKVKIGPGSIIYPGVSINYETIIKPFVTINMNAAIGHNCTIMDFCTISPNVACGGYTFLGEQSFLGIGSITLQSIQIGTVTTIGAGAVVIKDVPNGATIVGNPGRVIKIKEV